MSPIAKIWGVPRAKTVPPPHPSLHPCTYRWPYSTGEAVQAGGALEKKRGEGSEGGWLQGPQPRAHGEGGAPGGAPAPLPRAEGTAPTHRFPFLPGGAHVASLAFDALGGGRKWGSRVG